MKSYADGKGDGVKIGKELDLQTIMKIVQVNNFIIQTLWQSELVPTLT